jgi:hypothetical protein
MVFPVQHLIQTNTGRNKRIEERRKWKKEGRKVKGERKRRWRGGEGKSRKHEGRSEWESGGRRGRRCKIYCKIKQLRIEKVISNYLKHTKDVSYSPTSLISSGRSL